MKHPDPMTELRRATEHRGGIAALALKGGMSAPYVSNVLAGRQPFGPKLLAALGLRKVITYERVGP
jgi:hypothetical protein